MDIAPPMPKKKLVTFRSPIGDGGRTLHWPITVEKGTKMTFRFPIKRKRKGIVGMAFRSPIKLVLAEAAAVVAAGEAY